MAERQKEKVREDNIVKNLEAMSNNKQSVTPHKISDQVSRNNACGMEKRFQEIFDLAFDKINNSQYKIEDGDEDNEVPNDYYPVQYTNDGSRKTSDNTKDVSYVNNQRDIYQIESELRNLQHGGRNNLGITESVSRSRSKESAHNSK